ncbi:hypothetical protein Q3G72_012751 [Acer saccharum]|nr:hypothetical protein Q3G72_012751 [Acer saccharum]
MKPVIFTPELEFFDFMELFTGKIENGSEEDNGQQWVKLCLVAQKIRFRTRHLVSKEMIWSFECDDDDKFW